MPYEAPLSDYRLLLATLGFGQIAATARFGHATPDTVDAILTEAARLSETTLAPLNRAGDLHPAVLVDGEVRTSPGFAAGFRAVAEGGWIGISAAPKHGGMGLPLALATCVGEMMGSACLSLQLCPLMTQGQIDALEIHASPELQALYIPKLISGQWNGTMNLTEPQAGSDVGALRTKAEPLGDGTYAITGEKIYISWADNDFTENTCHLVLARLPDGAAGTKGISLFMVPKYLPDASGNAGTRNALRVVRLEHKMGLHGSPTAVMAYEGAKGWLVGAPHKGMAAMFTMMNAARLGVGMQGVCVAEAALQQALSYAEARVQGGTALQGPGLMGHPDVRRMLAEMRAETFGARAIGLACAVALDMARATGDADWQARAAFLTPIAKAYGTDTGHHVAQLGIQVHGGMGFIEDTGAAQFVRDVRVTQIYEGTNGIQALDLVGRKMMDDGKAAFALLDEVAATAALLPPDLGQPVQNAVQALRSATTTLLAQDALDRAGAAVAYARAFAQVLGAGFHLRAAQSDPARLPLARFAVTRLLPRHAAWLAEAQHGAEGLAELTAETLRA